jgi:hypothetical protein
MRHAGQKATEMARLRLEQGSSRDAGVKSVIDPQCFVHHHHEGHTSSSSY